MSFSTRKLRRHYSIYISAASAYASTAFLLAHADMARAAVFEEMYNGTVVTMDGGVAEGAPPSDMATGSGPLASPAQPTPAQGPANASKKMPRLRPPFTASVLFDAGTIPPAKTPPRLVRTIDAPAANQGAPASSPHPISGSFAEQQERMRRMANQVGLSYGQAPGVIRARLSRQQFATLFTALIRHESNFNPNAVSPKGASGLGQLMPATALDLGLSDVFSASDNLDGSARYLTAMLDKFGSADLALAAYNAGPAAVAKYAGIPPYPETQQYVAAILSTTAAAPRLADSEPTGSGGMAALANLFARNSRPASADLSTLASLR